MFRAAFRAMPGMGNQQQGNAAGHAHGLPSLFVVFDAILPGDVQRVIKNECGGLKTDAMLAPVIPVFNLVP